MTITTCSLPLHLSLKRSSSFKHLTKWYSITNAHSQQSHVIPYRRSRGASQTRTTIHLAFSLLKRTLDLGFTNVSNTFLMEHNTHLTIFISKVRSYCQFRIRLFPLRFFCCCSHFRTTTSLSISLLRRFFFFWMCSFERIVVNDVDVYTHFMCKL